LGRHFLWEHLEGDESAFGVADWTPTSLSVAPAWIAFAAGLCGVHEGDHAEWGRFTPKGASGCDSFADEFAGEVCGLVSKAGTDPGPGPGVLDVLGEGPGGDPKGVGLFGEEYEASAWRHELRGAWFLAIVVTIR